MREDGHVLFCNVIYTVVTATSFNLCELSCPDGFEPNPKTPKLLKANNLT